MTVLDTSGAIDFLLGTGAAAQVGTLLEGAAPVAAPDLLVFEVVAVLRRLAGRGQIHPDRAGAAVSDLGEVPVELFATLPLRGRAFALRDNLTAADAFFVALAEVLDEPLATKDRRLATMAGELGLRVVVLEEPAA